jgi:tetratricopeptide (TPR) repeat protein
LENAQKFIAKGQLDRAIRDYEQIVTLDSCDIRDRQKLAELLVRVGRKEDAIAEYETISNKYASSHFYLKAIAVHKQIQKLDPANINLTLALASLYERQGLIGNALAEYNMAVNYYLDTGSLAEAIDVIEKMLAADFENLNTHLKCAETYFSAGLSDKAYESFMQLAHLLRKSGDESAFNRVCDRVRNLYPDKKDFALDFQLEGSETFGERKRPEMLIATEESWELVEERPLYAGAETIPALKDVPFSAEPLSPPPDMTWEEEIDLALLEDEGVNVYSDDAGGDPDAMESAEELLQQDGIAVSAEISALGEIGLSETFGQPEGELEGAPAKAGISDAGGAQPEPADLTEIEMEIEGTAISSMGWLEDSAQLKPVEAGIDEAATGEAGEAMPPFPPRKRQPNDLAGQFNDFKKGVDKQLDKGDTEAHYNLGIAYKEMGLFDAALAEFQAASIDPQRRIDSLTLEGICLRDMGSCDKAEEVFTETLLEQRLTVEEKVSLKYELAFLYEKMSREEDALRLYRQVRAENPGFRDSAKKIALLEGGEISLELVDMELLELEVEELE